MAEEVLREGMFIVASGEMGSGKTHRTEGAVEMYVKHHKQRCAVIFDPNNEERWHKYKTIFFNVIEVMEARKKRLAGEIVPWTKSEKELQKIALIGGRDWKERIRRIEPFYPDGMGGKKKMDPIHKRETMIAIFHNIKRSLIFLDDVNSYISNFEATEVQAVFTNIRHSSNDCIFHIQSVNPLRPVHYTAVSIIRMHHDRFSVSRIEDRLAENYEALKIAQIIVDIEYQKKYQHPEKSPKWHYYNSYCVVVDFNRKRITGCTKQQFIVAAERYVKDNLKVLREIERDLAWDKGKRSPGMEERKKALGIWIMNKLEMGMWGG
jgi:hypothetical protein